VAPLPPRADIVGALWQVSSTPPVGSIEAGAGGGGIGATGGLVIHEATQLRSVQPASFARLDELLAELLAGEMSRVWCRVCLVFVVAV